MIDRARKILVDAINRFRGSPAVELKLVRDAFEQSDLLAATERIDLVKQLYPDRSDVNELYAQIYAAHEDWSKVRTAIELIAADPDADFYQTVEAAKLFRKLGCDDEAVKLFRRVGQDCLAEQAGVTWNSIGSIYFERGEPANALEAFTEGVCRSGQPIWPDIVVALRDCPLDEVVECRRKMLSLLPAELGDQFFKMLSLLEQKLYAGGRIEKEPMLRSIRKASQLAFAKFYPEIPQDDHVAPLKPSFLIIGAMKCGTTSLFNLIAQHPKCLVPFEKELHFFQFPQLDSEWYFEHFPRVAPAAGYISGDASPSYYIFDIVERVKDLLPDVKLIFIQRDPAQRAISHVRHNHRLGLGVPGIQQAISEIDELEREIVAAPEQAEQLLLEVTYRKRKHNHFLVLGCYELLLRRWRRAFGPEQLLTLDLGDLSQNPQSTMAEVFRFIGLDPVKVVPVKLNQADSAISGSHAERVVQRLEGFYRRVAELTVQS